MTAAVLSLEAARRRRAIALQLVALEPPWRPMGNGWQARPGSDGDVWIRYGLRERLFEACRLGRLERPLHCPACGRPLRQGMVTYREMDPPDTDEVVSWAGVRICGGCVERPSDG